MLILAKISKSSAGGYAQYLEGKAQASELGDYYLKDGERVEAPGRWAQGADQFGLDSTRPVTAEQLHTLMDVRRPDTNETLRRIGGSGEAVAAIDATFSAPKSVSAIWAIGSPEVRTAVEPAHETAIDQALTYATQQVLMLRRRVSADTVIHEKAVGLVATSWRHSTARAVEDQVPDPQRLDHRSVSGWGTAAISTLLMTREQPLGNRRRTSTRQECPINANLRRCRHAPARARNEVTLRHFGTAWTAPRHLNATPRSSGKATRPDLGRLRRRNHQSRRTCASNGRDPGSVERRHETSTQQRTWTGALGMSRKPHSRGDMS